MAIKKDTVTEMISPRRIDKTPVRLKFAKLHTVMFAPGSKINSYGTFDLKKFPTLEMVYMPGEDLFFKTERGVYGTPHTNIQSYLIDEA